MFDKLFRKKSDPLEAAHAVALRGLPADWQTVWLQIESEPGGARTSVDRFVTTKFALTPVYDKNVDPKAFDLFAAMAAESSPPWTMLTIRYDRDAASGDTKTKLEFGYDPVPADYRHERRLEWKKQNLPELG